MSFLTVKRFQILVFLIGLQACGESGSVSNVPAETREVEKQVRITEIKVSAAEQQLTVAANDKLEEKELPDADDDVVYQTYGVHNSSELSPCASRNCVYERTNDEPENPIYPEYWVSDWNMYVVSKNYADNPPPYQGKPPVTLTEGVDYTTSKGTSYYDSTWESPSTGKQEGAMMEHYEKRCLPIFPIKTNFTCSFISLGDTAFFLTYEEDRPVGMPPVCLFSKFNHSPRRDFIKHLPYSSSDSQRIGEGGQGYSFWVSASDGKPIQTGVSPDRTDDEAIMFGYGFQAVENTVRPQSFYFSGYPAPPANAPIVSQNYTDFRVEKPDPNETWGKVSGLDLNSLPECHLFEPLADEQIRTSNKRAPTWSDIGRWNRKGD